VNDITGGELSPSGHRFYQTFGGSTGRAVDAIPYKGATFFSGHEACLWIDEDHVLATDAVFVVPPAAANPPNAIAEPLGFTGQCAGRYPAAG
jgi:hypothetical protein